MLISWHVWRHTEDAKLGELRRTKERLCRWPSVPSNGSVWILLNHLLVCHDVLHDEIRVLLSNRLIQFLLVLPDQLLDVNVVVLLLQLLLLHRLLCINGAGWLRGGQDRCGHGWQRRLTHRLMLHLLLLQHELVLHVGVLLGAIAVGFELGH